MLRRGILKWYWICSLRVTTIIPFPFVNVTFRIRLFTGFVIIWATRWVPYVEQDKLTLPEHLRPPLFIGVRITQSLVFYIVLLCCYSSICLFVCMSVCLSFSFLTMALSVYFDFCILLISFASPLQVIL